jgi:HEAT repeat protein
VTDDNQVQVVWKFARDIRQAGSAGGSIRRVILPIAEALENLLAAGEIAKATQRVIDADGRSVSTQQVELILDTTLELALAGEDPTLKARALRVVATGERRRFKESARAALDSTDSEVALAATVALGVVGDKTDIARLEARTQGRRAASAAICEAAAVSLETLGRGPQTAMAAAAGIRSTESAERLASLAVLSQLMSVDAVAGLAKILNGGNKTLRDERVAAARALGKQAPKSARAVKALLAGAGTPDAAVRASCIGALASAASAGMRSRVSYWKVLEFLSDKDERVRSAAIRAAAKLDPVRFAKELKRVRAAGSELVILSIADVLGDIPGAIALGRLLDLAVAPHVGMRTAAARGLAKRKEAKAILAMPKLLTDEAPAVRAAALSNLKDADRLKPFLQDSSPEVRAAALGALVRELGKADTVALVAAQLASSGSDRSQQLLLAQSWLVRE